MTPSEFAEDELVEWELAMAAQRAAERELLEAAAAAASAEQLQELVQRVQRARTRADLMLADAVQLKCSYRDSRGAPLEPPLRDEIRPRRR